MKRISEPPQPPTWGEGVKAYRQIQHMTQHQLAARCGCSQRAISRIENGSSTSDGMRVRIAEALGVSVYRLFPYKSQTDDVA